MMVFPLLLSQREVISCVNASQTGSITAVSGPPGTGKTTLLQSVIADEYVKRALEGKEPPIIVVSSCNNQAITNVIDGLKSITPSDKIPSQSKTFFKRWINDEDTPISFATYFPSDMKYNEASTKYQVHKLREHSFLQDLSSDAEINKSKEPFLKKMDSYFGVSQNNDIKSCQEIISLNLKKMDCARRSCINSLYALTEALPEDHSFQEHYKLIQRNLDKINNEISALRNDLHKANKRIDIFNQRLAFWRTFSSRHRFLIFLSKYFNFFEKKLRQKILKNLSEEENSVDKNSLNPDKIIKDYGTKVSQNYKFIHQTMEELNNKLPDSKLYETQLNQLTVLKQSYIAKLDELKKFNPDFDLIFNESACKKDLINTLDDKLDIHIRFMEFWYAVHYYECSWLLKVDILTEKQWNATYQNVLEKLYTRMAFISPCLVTTLFTLPSLFHPLTDCNDKKHAFMYNYIDLLIVDEAGQVSPEIGAGCFSLAKKALVLGDEYQIAPVWNTDKVVDVTLAKTNHLYSNYKDFSKFACSESNLLRMAKHACLYHNNDKDLGLFLSEHRRCRKEIISYCNELVYNNRLEPKKEPMEQDIYFSPMQHIDVPTAHSLPSGSSHYNEQEAIAIARWIEENKNHIMEIYQTDNLENIIGIITPFKSQTTCIKHYVNNPSITIGTVHAFQGGEREIILFSSVYGKSEKCSFIDNSPNLLNVAVSRAKTAFIVFGSYECLNTNKTSPSGLLIKHLKRVNI